MNISGQEKMFLIRVKSNRYNVNLILRNEIKSNRLFSLES
jgi:hypothetical protein